MPRVTIADWARDWEALAKSDPLWAAAGQPGRRRNQPNAWDTATFLWTGQQDVETIGHLLDLTSFSNKTVMEVGCGAGRLVRALAAQGARVIGIDVSYAMLVLARKHTAPFAASVVLAQGSGCDLSMVATACCDVVLSWHVMQHIPDREIVMSLLAEIYRVLKVGGVACIHIAQRSAKNIRWRLYQGCLTFGVAG